ncbi:MAG: hypothetical protein R6X10_16430 [Desulfobacterales bacterium]
MKFISAIMITFMIFCLSSTVLGQEIITGLTNRWPYTPPKAIAVSSDYVFLADGDVILVLDKSDLNNPEPVKRIHLSVSEGITGITYSEPYLYAATGHHGLAKINVSPGSIADPFIATTGPIPELTDEEIEDGISATGLTRGVVVSGNNAYAAFTRISDTGLYDTGIQVVDLITDETRLVLSDTALVPDDKNAGGFTEARGVAVSGNYAYLADAVNGIQFFDISFSPPEFKDTAGIVPALDVDAPGDGYAYMACGFAGMQILDIVTNPELPEITTVYPDSDDPAGDITFFQYNGTTTDARSVQLAGDFAYIADRNSGLEIINVSTRSNPQKLESPYSTNLTQSYSVHVDNNENSAYLADYQSGLTKIDVTDPSAVSRVTAVNHSVSDTNKFFLKIEGDVFYGYILDSGGSGEGMRILEFAKIRQADSIDFAIFSEFTNVRMQSFLATEGEARDIKVVNYKITDTASESFAFIADGSNGLQMVNVTNKKAPRNSFNLSTSDARGIDLDASGSFAFIADGADGLRVIQILQAFDTYPINPPEMLQTIPIPDGTAKDVLFAGDYLYVAAGSEGLQVIKIIRPNLDLNPDATLSFNLVASLDTPGDAKALDFYYDYVFIADGASGLQIVDVGNNGGTPENPLLAGSIDTPGDASGVWVNSVYSQDLVYAYIADGDKGYRVIDVTDPANPVKVENLTYDTPGFASDVAVNDTSDIAIVADGSGGLTILSMARPIEIIERYPDNSSSELGNCFIRSTLGGAVNRFSNLWIPLTLLIAALCACAAKKSRK